MPLNAANPTGTWPEGFGVLLQVTDGSLRELASLPLGQVQQSLADHLGSIAQRAFRGLVRDLGLFAQEGTGPLISGVGTQQFEHMRVIAHGSNSWIFWGIEACASIVLYRNYLEKFKYISEYLCYRSAFKVTFRKENAK